MTNEITVRRGDVALDPAAIESTLHGLWSEYADHAREHEPMGARPRLANLVSWCCSSEQADLASRAVAELSASRPIRSLVLETHGNGGSASDSSAALSIQCRPAEPRPICYEEIRVMAHGETGQALPSLVESLMIPDLPVFLWFPGDPPLNSDVATRVLADVDRVVTDSHTFADPPARFRILHELMRQYDGRIVFTEMTWSRLGTWREAVGKLFDHEENRAFLPRIESVTITSADHPSGISDRSLLMAGWLASRLHWRPLRLETRTPARATFDAPNGTVEVAFRHDQPKTRGHLLSMEIRCADVSFVVQRCTGEADGSIRSSTFCSGEEAPGPAYHPPHYSIASLLAAAMEIRTPFVDWEEALAAIASLKT